MRRLQFLRALVGTSAAALAILLCEGLCAQPTPTGTLSVEIADILKFPDTHNQGSEDNRVNQNTARINFLRQLPDNSNRWFVNDLRGYLYLVNNTNTPTPTAQSYLNFQSLFPRFRFGTSGLATGFISMTPAPDFGTSGKFYTIHTEINTGSPTPDFMALGNAGNITGSNAMHQVITEWTDTNPSNSTFEGTRREIMRTATPQGFLHGQGDVAFNPLATPGNPDYGMLYISGGENGYDAYDRGTPQAQNPASIFGKMLRIDPNPADSGGTLSANGQYRIPATNPYQPGNAQGFIPETYASGFRNAHRIMWDSVTGTMFATDIGQGAREEVDIIHPGANYGWSQREGTLSYNQSTRLTSPLPPNANSDGFSYPVVEYSHGSGEWAIAGGFVYRGSKIPALYGKYVFGDIPRGRIFYSDVDDMIAADDGVALTTASYKEILLTQNGAPTTLENLILNDRGSGSLPSNRHDLRFGQTADGEIYVMTKMDGWIRQLVGTPGTQSLVISVDRSTGQVTLRNPTGDVVDLKSYEINSVTGSLNPNNGFWNSLADQGVPNWSENSPTAVHLAEAAASGALDLNNNDNFALGNAYKPVYTSFGTTGPEDLQFQYTTSSGTKTGLIEYTGIDVTNNLVLTVDPTTGYARLRNASPFNVTIDGYTINSFDGLLLAGNGNWKSLTDQGVSGWVEAAPDANNLSELNPLGSTQLLSGVSYDLGRIMTSDSEPDLQFTFFIQNVSPEKLGAIVYAQLGLPGDYNGDGTVNTADYVVWRETMGQQVAVYSGADGSGNGVIDQDDYDFWRARFGTSLASGSGSGSSLNAVPEPATAFLGLTFATAALAFRRRSW